MKVDYHVHTGLSRDAEGTVEMYCQAAALAGLREICFTNHLILLEAKTVSMKMEELDGHWDEIEAAKEAFPKLKILAGLEMDYFSDKARQIEKILETYPWDYSLGAVHFLDGLAITGKETAQLFFANKSLGEIYSRYFSEMENAAASGLFDAMAHLDVIRRYGDELVGEFPWSRWQPFVARVLEKIKEEKMTFELNTSGLRQGPQDCYPRQEVLDLAKEFGIKAVTLSSDAHKPEQVGFKIAEGTERVRKAGLELALFSRRKSRQVEI